MKSLPWFMRKPTENNNRWVLRKQQSWEEQMLLEVRKGYWMTGIEGGPSDQLYKQVQYKGMMSLGSFLASHWLELLVPPSEFCWKHQHWMGCVLSIGKHLTSKWLAKGWCQMGNLFAMILYFLKWFFSKNVLVIFCGIANLITLQRCVARSLSDWA